MALIDAREYQARLGGLTNPPPRARLQELRDTYLSRLVRHAAAEVPYYQRLFAERGLDPVEIRTVADLPNLPITTRETLSALEPADRRALGIDPSTLTTLRSSGSSGVPIVTEHTAYERQLYLAVRRRTLLGLGHSLRPPYVFMGLDPRTPEERAEPRMQANPLRVIECRQPIRDLLAELEQTPVGTLIGYPSVLLEVAEHASQELLRRIRPAVTIASGEVLTNEARRTLANAFGAPVTTTYASTECFWMGGECMHTGELHVPDDSVIVEVVDATGQPAAPGERGEVVVTALHSLAQPLIRYRIGDLAVRGSGRLSGEAGCGCGAPWSTLGTVEGRRLDYLTLPRGNRVHAYELLLPIRDGAPFVQRFQIVQDAPGAVRVRAIARVVPSASELEDAEAALARKLGDDVRVSFELVDSIEREANGKFRILVSNVARPNDAHGP